MYKGIYDFPEDLYHKAIEEKDNSILGVDKPDEFMELLKCQLIDEFGQSDEFEMYMQKLKALNDAEYKFLIEGDQSYEQFVQIYEGELEYMETNIFQVQNTDPRKSHARIRRSIQTNFPGRNPKMTVYEFYLDVNDLMKQSEEREMKDVLKKAVNE
jgi:hypothetical protein